MFGGNLIDRFRRSPLQVKAFALVCALSLVHLGWQVASDATSLRGPVEGTEDKSYDELRLFLISLPKTENSQTFLASQWETEARIPLTTKEMKTDFPKTFVKLFDPQTTIERLSYNFEFVGVVSSQVVSSFTFADTMSIRAFWRQPAFAELLKQIQKTNASAIIINIRGWKKQAISTEFDDPNDETRSLFKIPVRMIPGKNLIYVGTPGKEGAASSFSTEYVSDNVVVESRENRFHNSTLEQGCVACHEGLPSESEGTAMKANCSTCHKALAAAKSTHAPVSGDDCIACHSWSSEKKALTVEAGTPDACYTCHDDKKTLVESAAYPHAVAGDCLGCHSPHGSREHSLLKKNVYSLCIGCHADYGRNHPVANHPARLAKNADTNDQEISCISCHNPHGSSNKALLTVDGGRFALCLQCHQK